MEWETVRKGGKTKFAGHALAQGRPRVHDSPTWSRKARETVAVRDRLALYRPNPAETGFIFTVGLSFAMLIFTLCIDSLSRPQLRADCFSARLSVGFIENRWALLRKTRCVNRGGRNTA